MDFKSLISKIASMDDAVELPKAPELPKSVQLNEDAQLRVLAGQTTVLAESELMEKAKSKAQQKAAGAALAAKRGEGTAKGASKEMAKMDTKDLKKFAGTKHKGLPEKKDESVNEAAIDDYLDKKKAEKGDDSGRRQHKGSRYGGSAQKDDAEEEKAETKKGRKAAKESVELDIEEFNETFSQMVEAAKKEPSKKSADKNADSKKAFEKKFGGSAKDLTKDLSIKKKDSKVDEGSKPDFLDADKDGDKKEPMKKAIADKKKGAVGKKTVKESIERKLSFKEIMKLVVESGGQQKIDPKDQALFSWAQRVAKSKLGEGMKAEVYAGLVYERMGGRFEMYDVLSESTVVKQRPVVVNGKQVDLSSVKFSIYGSGTDEYDITDARFVDGTPLSDREIQQLYRDDTIIDMHRDELMQMSMGGNPHLR